MWWLAVRAGRSGAGSHGGDAMGLRNRRARVVASAVLATAMATAVVAATRQGIAAPAKKLDREEAARMLLERHLDRFGTQALTRSLRFAAGEQQSPGRSLESGADEVGSHAATQPGALPRAGL